MFSWISRIFVSPTAEVINTLREQDSRMAPDPAEDELPSPLQSLGFIPEWHVRDAVGVWALYPSTSAMIRAPKTRMLADLWAEEADRIVQAGGSVASTVMTPRFASQTQATDRGTERFETPRPAGQAS